MMCRPLSKTSLGLTRSYERRQSIRRSCEHLPRGCRRCSCVRISTLQKKEYNFLLNAQVMSYVEPEGTRFISDSNKTITNWPEQHYTNGVAKNTRTGNRFQFIVRAVKRLKFYLIGKGVAAADPVASYLIECLLYNVPDTTFAGDSYKDNVQNALLTCFTATKTDGNYAEWLEVNERKYLFRNTQPWTRQQAYDFVLAAWAYVENN